MTGIREPELTTLRKLAEDMAKRRGERATTGHLLAAIAAGSGSAADLLRERRLDAEVLLQAARVLTDDHADAVTRAMQRARELAARSPIREVAGTHLLFALCQERTTAAYRAITQCGSDVTKLRTVAMQVAMGIIGPRRSSASTQLALPPSPLSSPRIAVRPAAAAAPQSPPKPVAIAPAPVPVAPRPKRRLPAPAPSASGEPLSRFELDAKRMPTLASLGHNLTLAAARGELDPVFGREAEIDRTLDVLAKRQANCPCLVGPAGVGKTSVVRGLAQRIADRQDVGPLDDKILVEIDAAALLAGTGMRGSLAERMTQIKTEVARAEGRIVLFFDEMHSILAGDDEAVAELRSALARGELACIGATTPED
jgi:ATP-dependent Clp protease ATP-binding subunit ClpC